MFSKVTLDFLLDQKRKKEPTDGNLMGYNDVVADEVFEGMLKEMEIEKSRSTIVTIVRQLSNARRVDPTSDLELTP